MILTKITLNKIPETTVGTKPTHRMIASDDKYENKTIIGSLWIKVGPDGNKFLSGGLNKENRTFKKLDGTEGIEKAYVIITLDEYKRLTQSEVKTTGYTGAVDSSELGF